MTYSNRGMVLEKLVTMSCEQYKIRNLAIINKIPTPIRVVSNTRGRVQGFFEKKGTIDFEGVLKSGRHIAFDTKETKGKALPLANIQEHQINYLENVSKMNGVAFLLVCFSELDKYYRLDIKDLRGYIKEPWDNNKKSISINFFKTYCKEIKSTHGLRLDFLCELEE